MLAHTRLFLECRSNCRLFETCCANVSFTRRFCVIPTAASAFSSRAVVARRRARPRPWRSCGHTIRHPRFKLLSSLPWTTPPSSSNRSRCTTTTWEHSFLASVPTVTNERERLRCCQRGYKCFRGCKTLAATHRKHYKPYARQTQSPRESLQCKLLLLQKERALVEDRVAMKSPQAWEHITRIREYADKGALRTVSEWRHSAVKIIDPCGLRNERG
ncbi:hypothetical protein PF010_g8326 [Phytophthora fragariae]|uniref:Uncharacterized protein n=2 Tax=Phytophthora fragariae TaxID=53985 RepID=A0A6G0LFP7_9STRA|nr:hypothetical protein PF010_g8326 [Phytophthora fragariae]